MKVSLKVTLEDIRQAEAVIAPAIRSTEMDHSLSASKLLGKEIYLKLENQQYTGSFKLRGAFNRIHALTADEKKRGVIACSAGNHAQGVAFSATRAGVRSVIVMPITASLVKIEATKNYGAEVVLFGTSIDEAYEEARRLQQVHNFTLVHPYEDEKVIAGQGTVGLDILRQLPDVEAVVVPIGGGGLISGVATAIKALKPSCRIIGVQSAEADGMSQLFHQEKMLKARRRISTIADGIAIKKPSQIIFDSFISKLVDEVVTVSDDEIAEAMVFLLERAKVVVEGAGATGLAAAMQKKVQLGSPTCLILSGGNIDLNIMAKVIEKGLLRKGRLAELAVVVDDLPGILSQLSQAIGELGANIIEVHHDRLTHGLFLRETRINFILETSGETHIKEIRTALEKLGARLLV